ncbi:ABC transporter ATP-binding protein [Neomegalonema perideroedes]|uniref:ABC transporter ATP-binding protein n=1 Tax=Neomegalonema perideroedes TaxID=217219 RepID=UPI0003814BA7|nr:ABC transporter ATP-binding protein [Neomegalonema perideroedes]
MSGTSSLFSPEAGAALSTKGLTRVWGAFVANSDIDFALPTGARHALIGPNGAGKTTFINMLTGVLAPSSGQVFIGGEEVTGLSQEKRVAKGVARTFQINNLFPGLTVLESVLLAILERKGEGDRWFRPLRAYKPEIEEAMELIRDLGLEAQAGEETQRLAYGKQRLVEIALALATRPRILLLDEPAAGVPAGESAEVFSVIARLPREVSILFIEHDMDLVRRFSERITVLVAGKILTEGAPEEIMSDPRVREVYLGEGHD